MNDIVRHNDIARIDLEIDRLVREFKHRFDLLLDAREALVNPPQPARTVDLRVAYRGPGREAK